MRILYFNLGSVKQRILAWQLEGFTYFFEHDIILWGPIPDQQFIYKTREIPILPVFEQTSIRTLFERLPEDWLPDIVTCDTSVLNYVPDIYLCPVKTLLFTRDSWSDTIFNRSIVECFDFVQSSTIDRELYNNYRVKLLPLSGFAVSRPEPGSSIREFNARDIDVIAIANYNDSFYHKRFKLFFRLSGSVRNNIKIRYFKNIERSEISRYYQRSKIVLDWAHTLSNRSYEAALNGCLLFSHEDNNLVNHFWIPWEEYIPYNDNNLPDLIEYYLANPAEARLIIGNAHKKAKGIATSWGEMAWDKVSLAVREQISVNERINYNVKLPAALKHYRTATALLYNYDYGTNFPSDWVELYFERLNESMSSTSVSSEIISPLIEAARMAFLLQRDRQALQYLDRLIESLPDYAWSYYLSARIYFRNEDLDKALDLAKHAAGCGKDSPELLRDYLLPVIEKGNTCDGRRITNYMWQQRFNHKNEYQVEALLHLSYELAGDIYSGMHEDNMAIDSYITAISYLAIPRCVLKAGALLHKSGSYETLRDISKKGIDDSPYDIKVVLYNAYAHLKLGSYRDAFLVLNHFQKSLKNFPGVRKFIFLRVIIKTLSPLILLKVKAVTRLISALIIRL